MPSKEEEISLQTQILSEKIKYSIDQVIDQNTEYVCLLRHKVDNATVGRWMGNIGDLKQSTDFILTEMQRAGIISNTPSMSTPVPPPLHILPPPSPVSRFLTSIKSSMGIQTKRKFGAFGVASKKYKTAKDAAGDTYMTETGELFSTPLIFPENPFNAEITKAKHILDIGCGIGRNLPWIMENTKATYYGLEPNKSMLKFFWEVQHPKYKPRVKLFDSIDKLKKADVKLDVVVSTFVFQHLHFLSDAEDFPYMGITEITKELRALCKPDAVWIMYEHDWEGHWIDRWTGEANVNRLVYIRDYKGIPKLAERGAHHLIIWKN
jgi:SAM-dependent methyltransferase